MYLTKSDIAKLPASAFDGVGKLIQAVWSRFSCGISEATAGRILADHAAGLIQG